MDRNPIVLFQSSSMTKVEYGINIGVYNISSIMKYFIFFQFCLIVLYIMKNNFASCMYYMCLYVNIHLWRYISVYSHLWRWVCVCIFNCEGVHVCICVDVRVFICEGKGGHMEVRGCNWDEFLKHFILQSFETEFLPEPIYQHSGFRI